MYQKMGKCFLERTEKLCTRSLTTPGKFDYLTNHQILRLWNAFPMNILLSALASDGRDSISSYLELNKFKNFEL